MQCDICAIKNLIYRYADRIDRGDLEGVAELFQHGSIVAVDGQGQESVIAGAEAVKALYSAFTRLYQDDGTPHTLHMTSNVTVDVAADGRRAEAKSYAVVFQALEDFPLQPIIGVRYADQFEQSDDGWHFSERRIETRLSGDLDRHLLQKV